MITLSRVSVSLGGKPVVTDVSAQLEGGQLVALVGPNGAGKTSLLRAILALVPAQGGALFKGRPIAAMAARERARCIGYLPQGHQLHWPLCARTIVALGRYPHGAVNPDALPATDRSAVEEAMRLTGIHALAERPATALSGGERARVALARVLAGGGDVLLADEPTAALDPRFQLEIFTVLQGIARQGRLVVVVTHDLGLAARFADRVMVMADGALRAFAPPDTALSDANLAAHFGVFAHRAVQDGQTVLVPWSVG